MCTAKKLEPPSHRLMDINMHWLIYLLNSSAVSNSILQWTALLKSTFFSRVVCVICVMASLLLLNHKLLLSFLVQNHPSCPLFSRVFAMASLLLLNQKLILSLFVQNRLSYVGILRTKTPFLHEGQRIIERKRITMEIDNHTHNWANTTILLSFTWRTK